MYRVKRGLSHYLGCPKKESPLVVAVRMWRHWPIIWNWWLVHLMLNVHPCMILVSVGALSISEHYNKYMATHIAMIFFVSKTKRSYQIFPHKLTDFQFENDYSTLAIHASSIDCNILP